LRTAKRLIAPSCYGATRPFGQFKMDTATISTISDAQKQLLFL